MWINRGQIFDEWVFVHNLHIIITVVKEIYEVIVVFMVLEDEHIPVGYSKSSCHLVWDLKMDFTRKARWVKDGNKHPDLDNSNYAGVVSRERMRIALIYTALRGIEVLVADTQNTYIQAPTSKRHYSICGEEFSLEN